MKNRKNMGVWGLLILLCVFFCGTAFAAAPALTFALQTDGAELSGGGYVLTQTSPGDTLTVRFSVLRTDAAEAFTLFAIQNEIEFDMDFFAFVEGSIVTIYPNADADLQTRVRGQEIIKTAALGGPEYEPEQAFCEFQLKVKDNATGSGWVRCSQTAATDTDYSTVTLSERNLTVTVSAGGNSGSSGSGSGGSSSGGSSGGSSSGSSSGGSSGGSSSGSSSGGSSGGSSSGSSSGGSSGSSGSGGSSSGSGRTSGSGSSQSSGSVNSGETVSGGGTVADSGETGQSSNETTPVQTGENSGSDTASSDSTGSDTDSVASPDSVSVATGVTECPKDASCPLAAFSDLDPSAWYHDGVHFCVEQGIMNGYTDGTFGSQKIVSRAQIAMILWNREGNPDANIELNFQDVDANGWYAGAIRWALQKGILTGYNADFFGPNDILTRQQLAAILYRYSGSPAQSGAVEKLSVFEDREQIASYAQNAMAWAISAGLIQGATSVTLNPAGSATRAQTAVIMMRYLSGEKEGA